MMYDLGKTTTNRSDMKTDEIMELADDFAAYISNGASVNDQGRRTALLTSIEGLVRDGERYRWLRGACGNHDIGVYRDAWSNVRRRWLEGHEVDQAIDEIIAAQEVK